MGGGAEVGRAGGRKLGDTEGMGTESEQGHLPLTCQRILSIPSTGTHFRPPSPTSSLLSGWGWLGTQVPGAHPALRVPGDGFPDSRSAVLSLQDAGPALTSGLCFADPSVWRFLPRDTSGPLVLQARPRRPRGLAHLTTHSSAHRHHRPSFLLQLKPQVSQAWPALG